MHAGGHQYDFRIAIADEKAARAAADALRFAYGFRASRIKSLQIVFLFMELLDSPGHPHDNAHDVYDALLNQTDIATNANKYYIIQLLETDDASKNYYTWNRSRPPRVLLAVCPGLIG